MLALIELNSGRAKAQAPTVITVCGTGGAQYTALNAAANSIADDYSRVYDMQICPGTYTSGMHVAFNGTVEGMGTTADAVVLQTNCGSCQYYMGLGDIAAPYPGITLTVRNMAINGAVSAGSPAKAPRCVQVISGAELMFVNMHLENCQDGILENYLAVPYGGNRFILSGSTFDNNCSGSGPSHGIYINTGTVVVGPPARAVAGIAPAPGLAIFAGGTVSVQPNTFHECNIGYNVKLRPYYALVDGNNFVQNFTLSSSGAIDIPEGGVSEVIGNTMTFGPQTGQNNNPPQAVLLGGTYGKNLPENLYVSGNTMVLSGVTKPFTPVASLTNNTSLVVVGNTFPLASALGGNGVLEGQGTIGTGNVYADSTPVPTAVQNSFADSTTQQVDYRGVSGPQSAVMSANDKTVWGGNGVLTVTPSTGAAVNDWVIGGPGGLNVTQADNPALFVWTDPASVNNNITLANSWNMFSFGANDQVYLTGKGCGGGAPINSLAGTVTVNWLAPTTGSNCNNHDYSNMVIHGLSTSTNTIGYSVNVHPGASLTVDGSIFDVTLSEASGHIAVNNVTIVPTTTAFAAQEFSVTAFGGQLQMGPDLTIANGVASAINGWWIITYENGPVNEATIVAGGSGSNFIMTGKGNATGGAVIYPGNNKFTTAGGTRSLGPPASPITYHVQASLAGTAIGAAFGAFNVYLDGPGVAAVQRANAQNQSDYVEIDPGGSGTVTIQQPWRAALDKCGLGGGVTQTGSIVAGGTTTLSFSTGGKAVFQGTASGVVCNSVSINPSTLKFVQSTPLIAAVQPNTVVGVISGGCPPYTVGDTTHFAVVGASLDAKVALPANTYSTTISDSLP